MITRGMLNGIKRLDVSKNREATMERVIALWQDMSEEQKEQVSEYDISNSTISRTKSMGNISVKVAAALSLVTGIDPYYLTAETDEFDCSADEDTVRQFLIDHGYERILNISDIIENKEDKMPRVKNEPDELEDEPVVVEEIIISGPEDEEISSKGVMSIQEFADIQMSNLSNAEKKSIYEMPDEDFAHLLKTLELQSKYTSKAKNLLGLIRLILIR